MASTPQSRLELVKELIRIPSVTGSPEETLAAEFIMQRLSALDYFRQNRSHLEAIPTPLEGDGRELFSVAARVMARRPTPKTVVFISHYDVVDASAYGKLKKYAFDPDRLAAEPGAEAGYIYGRGSMDMKCGAALEMELIRDFAADREMFGVNIIALFVPDEENSGCGMRAAAGHLASLKKSEGLTYIACIDTEPSEPGISDTSDRKHAEERNAQTIFLGSLGKLMPAFYCRGIGAHVGNYYGGLSAALLSSHIVTLAEAAPELADPLEETRSPSWACLEHSTLKESYSVTLPDRSVAYFNCLAATKTPPDVLAEMKKIAMLAATRTAEQVKNSRAAIFPEAVKNTDTNAFTVKVLEFADIFAEAAQKYGGGREALEKHIAEFALAGCGGDLRERGIAVLERIIEIAAPKPPFIALSFLPPYNPQIDSSSVPHIERAARRIASEAKESYGVDMDIVRFFAGISDMSFAGFSGSDAEVEAYGRNCPGWGALFEVPFGAMREIDMPVMNLGPCGHDAHKPTERLETHYSLDILPRLLVFAVRALSQEWDNLS